MGYYTDLSPESESSWISKIKTITNYNTRVKVARIVWWDNFAQDNNGKSVFDKYIKTDKDRPVTAENIMAGLIQAGYSKEAARKRTEHLRKKQGGKLRDTGYGNMVKR